MRLQCIKIAGSLWKLHDEVIDETSAGARPMFRTASIMRSDWEMPISELLDTSPSRFLERLGADFYQCGAVDAGGALIAGLHGEWARHHDLMRIHVHLAPIGDMADVVDRLRHLPGYAPIIRKYGALERSTPCIRMSKESLNSLPDPFTYIFQRFWPSQWVTDAVDGIVAERAIRQLRRRCPSTPAESAVRRPGNSHQLQPVNGFYRATSAMG